MDKINVYDFDGTIYDGDSTIDFFLFSLKKNKKLIKYLPSIFIYGILYVLKIIKTKKFKEIFLRFTKDIDNLDELVKEFWETHENKINKDLLKQDNLKKYIVSASLEFLLKPYFKKYDDVKVIATKYENGQIEKNCKGKEKINRLKKEVKKLNINNFYSDSLVDLPLVELADNAYYVQKRKIEKWDTNKIKAKKIKKIIFISFLIFYLLLGVLLSYNYERTKDILLFEFDSHRIIWDISDIFGDHSRLTVHPLFVLLTEPIYFIINGITQDKMLAIIFIMALISSLAVTYLFKLLNLFNKNIKTNLLITLGYGLTFSNIIFVSAVELYNIASLILILLWYFIALKIKNGFTKSDYLPFITLGILTLSITITNYFVFLIACLVLLLAKKVNIKKIFIINLLVVLVFTGLNLFQKIMWQNTPSVLDFYNTSQNETNYMDFSLNFKKVKTLGKDMLYNSIVATDIKQYKSGKYEMVYFKKIGFLNKITITLFYLMVIFYIIKNGKKNLIYNIGLILALIFNLLLHFIYGNDISFLYSLHLLYLPFLLLGINIDNKSKLPYLILGLLLICQIFYNSLVYVKIIKMVKKILTANFFAKTFTFSKLIIITIFIIILVLILISLIIYLLKKMIDKFNINQVFLLIILVVLLETVFVLIKTTSKYEKIFGINIQSNPKNIITTNYQPFIKKYPEEVNSYLDYLKEYKEFVKDYQLKFYYSIPNINYYLLGMGNRRKLLFKDGVLLDLETKEVIKKFKPVNTLVIPNQNTILIKEKNNYFKIHENNNGVFIEHDGKHDAIEGTDTYLNIYRFSKQKYQNIKRVLYNDILFNIKDSKIIPNIIAYDEVWYRDAAIACMVLKQTNNTNLITDWVENITDLYDKKTDEKEPDNLGQLLYILSTQENINEELVEKIKKEAKKIAKKNKDGYYLFGKTNYDDHYVYQNKWYDLGIKAINQKNDFKIPDTRDSYDDLTWWNKTNNNNTYTSSINSPYLSWASYHKNKKPPLYTNLYTNNKLYPLSWDISNSKANYENISIISEKFKQNRIVPSYVLTSSEMLLVLLDDTNDLNIDVTKIYRKPE